MSSTLRLQFRRRVLAEVDRSGREAGQEAKEDVQGLLVCNRRLELEPECDLLKRLDHQRFPQGLGLSYR
jgi:hypothetical protein